MSVFSLKIIAIIAMLFDHVGYLIYGHFSWMNYIGRLAFPIFAFLLTEGYAHTHNLKKYFFRLFVFAILSQIPYMFFQNSIQHPFNLNILFTLLLGLLVIYFYETIRPKWMGILLAILCCILAEFCFFDYGWFGIAIILLFHISKNYKIIMCTCFVLLAQFNYLFQWLTTNRWEYIFIFLFASTSLIPICLYNGKKGKSLQYFFYWFYPLHFCLLWLISTVI